MLGPKSLRSRNGQESADADEPGDRDDEDRSAAAPVAGAELPPPRRDVLGCARSLGHAAAVHLSAERNKAQVAGRLHA
jgi:hypothetical protein